MKDDSLKRALLAALNGPAPGAVAHCEHDFDEELGMYWYGDAAPTPETTPKAASIVRVPTFELWREAHRARRDTDEWFIVPLD